MIRIPNKSYSSSIHDTNHELTCISVIWNLHHVYWFYNSRKHDNATRITVTFFIDNSTIFTQVLAVQHIGVSYICPESVLCVLNVHVVYQFRILQNTLLNLWSDIDEETDIVAYSNKCYEILKECIRKHQSLIEYSTRLENVFTLPILSTMVVFSVLMCFDTYELILVLLHNELFTLIFPIFNSSVIRWTLKNEMSQKKEELPCHSIRNTYIIVKSPC